MIKEIISKIESLKNLKDDYDGEGSIAPSEDLIDYSISYFNNSKMFSNNDKVRVYASVNGNICIEIYNNVFIKSFEFAEVSKEPTIFYY